ncbi:MAG: 23S rRNA (cytosine(1962)-C(5))-methyltransferase RlmI, partial [Lentisphaeria bacterium]|nr:23S rRNA (cytosine(1962)-C(5))-methyltransferase RlmI [Lentisphaeria bacterium]
MEILSREGEFLAKGAYSPSSSIPVKIWTFQEQEEIGREFFRNRLAEAYLLRQKIYGGT